MLVCGAIFVPVVILELKLRHSPPSRSAARADYLLLGKDSPRMLGCFAARSKRVLKFAQNY